MPYTDILYDKRDSVATITLNRPQVMNACTIKTYDEIIDALRDAEADDAVRVVVLTGAGPDLRRPGTIFRAIDRNHGQPGRGIRPRDAFFLDHGADRRQPRAGRSGMVGTRRARNGQRRLPAFVDAGAA